MAIYRNTDDDRQDLKTCLLFKFLKTQRAHQAPCALCLRRRAPIELKDSKGERELDRTTIHVLLMYADGYLYITSEEKKLFGYIRRVSAQSKQWNQQVPSDQETKVKPNPDWLHKSQLFWVMANVK